jgi:hypothetical protein
LPGRAYDIWVEIICRFFGKNKADPSAQSGSQHPMVRRGMRRRLSKKGPIHDRPSPDSPFKQSGNYPFVTIGGGGMLVQPAMLRSESTATSAKATFFIEVLSLDMTGNTYWRPAWSSSAEKPHCGADFSGANTHGWRELCAAIIAKLPPVLSNWEGIISRASVGALQISRIRENLHRMPQITAEGCYLPGARRKWRGRRWITPMLVPDYSLLVMSRL